MNLATNRYPVCTENLIRVNDVMAALLSLRELLAENIYADSKTPVESALITDQSGRELMAIPAQDVLPEPFKK